MEKEKILEALRMIKKVCEAYADCTKCPFRNWERLSGCHFKDIAPVHWCLDESEEPWRAFK